MRVYFEYAKKLQCACASLFENAKMVHNTKNKFKRHTFIGALLLSGSFVARVWGMIFFPASHRSIMHKDCELGARFSKYGLQGHMVPIELIQPENDDGCLPVRIKLTLFATEHEKTFRNVIQKQNVPWIALIRDYPQSPTTILRYGFLDGLRERLRCFVSLKTENRTRTSCSLQKKIRCMQMSGAAAVIVAVPPKIFNGYPPSCTDKKGAEKAAKSGETPFRKILGLSAKKPLITGDFWRIRRAGGAIPCGFISLKDYEEVVQMVRAQNNGSFLYAAVYGGNGENVYPQQLVFVVTAFVFAFLVFGMYNFYRALEDVNPMRNVNCYTVASSEDLSQLPLLPYKSLADVSTAATVATPTAALHTAASGEEAVCATVHIGDAAACELATAERCAVCLENYAVHEQIRQLPCRHFYHAHCIDPWLLTKNRCCPICKQDIRLLLERADACQTPSVFHDSLMEDERPPGDDEQAALAYLLLPVSAS